MMMIMMMMVVIIIVITAVVVVVTLSRMLSIPRTQHAYVTAYNSAVNFLV
jgi:regulator of protease activity HflC (stomatin/prohibitin superfamily)